MTKHFKENIKGTHYVDRPIAIAGSEDNESEIICPSCHCNTVIRGESDDYCTRCGHTLNVRQEEVETGKIVESDNMDDNSETLISNLPDALDAYYGRSKPEYQGAFSQLKGKGIRITSYVERDGIGRVTRSYSDGSSSSYGSDSQCRSAPRPFKESRSEE
jgi:hypothetical protein